MNAWEAIAAGYDRTNTPSQMWLGREGTPPRRAPPGHAFPRRGTFRGSEAVIAWFTRDLWRWYDEFTSAPEGFIEAGDRIVVPVHVQARALSGRTVDVHTCGSTSSATAS